VDCARALTRGDEPSGFVRSVAKMANWCAQFAYDDLDALIETLTLTSVMGCPSLRASCTMSCPSPVLGGFGLVVRLIFISSVESKLTSDEHPVAMMPSRHNNPNKP